MLRAHYICSSLATVIWECSLNQFSTLLFVSLFVNREPQQIFMGENTEYRANLVKAKVNFRLNYRIPGQFFRYIRWGGSVVPTDEPRTRQATKLYNLD